MEKAVYEEKARGRGLYCSALTTAKEEVGRQRFPHPLRGLTQRFQDFRLERFQGGGENIPQFGAARFR